MSKIAHSGYVLVVLAAVALPLAATAQEATTHVALKPAELDWSPMAALPPGATVAVLEGDLAQEGFFAVRATLPANYRIPPHYHPATERVTVLSGTLRLGLGETFDDVALTAYEPGSYLSMPAGMRHFVATGDSEVVVQVASIGPWGITYVNPADDPRTQTE